MKNKETSYSQAVTLARKKAAIRISYGMETWGAYGSALKYYDSTFVDVLHGQSLVDLVSSKKAPLVIDLMAPSDTLAELFEQLPQKEKKGFTVSLMNQRNEFQIERDNRLGIQQFAGDLTDFSEKGPWQKLKEVTKDKKADVVIQHGMLGVDCLPIHGRYYRLALQNVWDFLSPDEGTLLMQAPTEVDLGSIGLSTERWVEKLQSNGIEAKLDLLRAWPALRVVKRPDSPIELPFIMPLQERRKPKWRKFFGE